MSDLRLPPLTRTQGLSPVRQPNARPMNLRQNSRDSELFREVRRALRSPEAKSPSTLPPDPAWIVALENLFQKIGQSWHAFCLRLRGRVR